MLSRQLLLLNASNNTALVAPRTSRFIHVLGVPTMRMTVPTAAMRIMRPQYPYLETFRH